MDDHNGILRAPRKFLERLTFENFTEKEQRLKFRLQSDRIQALLESLRPHLEPMSLRSHAIPAETKLLTALRYYATGSFMEAQGEGLNVSKASVSRIVGNVTPKICNMVGQWITMPETVEEIMATQEKFQRVAGMPFVIGAVDGSLVRILGPHQDENAYVDRHGNHSINLLGVCDADRRFTYINVNWPGSANDSFVFNHSALKDRLEAGRHRRRPYSFLLGDSAFAVRPYVMTPLANPSTPPEVRFNRAHKGTRHVIESAFGQLKMTFRCLDDTGGVIMLEPRKAAQMIGACCVLYNMRKHDQMEDVAEDRPAPAPAPRPQQRQPDDAAGRAVRDLIVDRVFR